MGAGMKKKCLTGDATPLRRQRLRSGGWHMRRRNDGDRAAWMRCRGRGGGNCTAAAAAACPEHDLCHCTTTNNLFPAPPAAPPPPQILRKQQEKEAELAWLREKHEADNARRALERRLQLEDKTASVEEMKRRDAFARVQVNMAGGQAGGNVLQAAAGAAGGMLAAPCTLLQHDRSVRPALPPGAQAH